MSDDCAMDGGDGLAWDGVFYAVDEGYWHSLDSSTYLELTETPLDPAAIDFGELHQWLAAAGYDDATRLLADVVVTFDADADSDGEAEPHFSYVLGLAPTPDGQVVRLVVDGVDGRVTKQSI